MNGARSLVCSAVTLFVVIAASMKHKRLELRAQKAADYYYYYYHYYCFCRCNCRRGVF
jgi:hypothetical protein